MEEPLVAADVADVERDQVGRRDGEVAEAPPQEGTGVVGEQGLEEGPVAAHDVGDGDPALRRRPPAGQPGDGLVGVEVDLGGGPPVPAGEEEHGLLHDVEHPLVDPHHPQLGKMPAEEAPEGTGVADVGEVVGEDEGEPAAGPQELGGVQDERHPHAAGRVHGLPQHPLRHRLGPPVLLGREVAEPHVRGVADHGVDRERLHGQEVVTDGVGPGNGTGGHGGLERVGRQLDPEHLGLHAPAGAFRRHRVQEGAVTHAGLEDPVGPVAQGPLDEHLGGDGRRVVRPEGPGGRAGQRGCHGRADVTQGLGQAPGPPPGRTGVVSGGRGDLERPRLAGGAPVGDAGLLALGAGRGSSCGTGGSPRRRGGRPSGPGGR